MTRKTESMDTTPTNEMGTVEPENRSRGKTGRPGRDFSEIPVKRLSLVIPAELHLRLKRAAVEEDRSMVDIATDAIEEFLAKMVK